MGQQATSIFDVNTGVYYEKLRNEKLEKLRISISKKKKEKRKRKGKQKKKETPLNERNCVDSNLHLTYLQLKRGRKTILRGAIKKTSLKKRDPNREMHNYI